MCLIKTHNEIKRAYEDIPVYKVLAKDNCAPYIGGYQYHRGLNTPVELPPSICHNGYIDNGYLHAYTDELVARHTAEALLIRESFIYESRRTFKVVKMVIPKGEKYWAGDSYDVAATALEWREDELVKE